MIRYTKDHEWVKEDGSELLVGVSAHAVESLGDIVFLELPEVGSQFNAGDAMVGIESVKAASDIYAPVTGTVVAVNQILVDAPETLNEDSNTWVVRLTAEDTSAIADLMTEEAYLASLDS